MLLQDKYYKVLGEIRENAESATFRLLILPECEVYEGHFPGKPVCPGVCNIETIKECAMMLSGKRLRIRSIKQCRLLAVATPLACPEIDVNISLASAERGFITMARIYAGDTVYMEFNGLLEIEENK